MLLLVWGVVFSNTQLTQLMIDLPVHITPSFVGSFEDCAVRLKFVI
jgi:hypothetical protein